MNFAAVVELRCPDCRAAVGAAGAEPVCPRCRRAFGPEGGVWNLLPGALEAPKAAEDALHVGADMPTWRRLFFHKRYWLQWCDSRWLPEIVSERTRTFLEIGGGLCYASALAKARAPSATVVATDVSPAYLRRHACQTGAILGASADVYAAVDAETLPFEDRQFDAVYSQIVLYRLGDPVRALREIQRVLAPGGRYLGIERASPWLRPFRRREERVMLERARRHGVGERPIRYRDWQTMLGAAGIGPAALAPVPGRRLKSPRLRRLGNAARQIYVTIRLGASS